MHSARKVANFFLKTDGREGLSPLQVIKLVYIAHGFTLANRKKALIADVVEAWEYGPVVADLYHALKRYGNDPIPILLEDWIASNEFDDDEKTIMGKVLDHYGQQSGIQLSSLTHQEGTPWHQVWTKFGRNAIIPDALTQEHYEEKIQVKKVND